MKTRIALPLSMLGLVLGLVLGIQPVKAQNEPVLNGSTLKAEDIAAKADAVFVGEIIQMGFPNPSAPGLASYGTQVKVLQVLRGSVDAQITVTIDTHAMNREEPPKVGTQYIFFVKKEGDHFKALKLLTATDANIAKVKALIAAAPAPK